MCLGIRTSWFVGIILLSLISGGIIAEGSDWSRFRGPNGSGICADRVPTPVTWNDIENLKWTVDLPGPGSSSPIVVGDKVFVTCWNGYGLSIEDPGDQANLKRHLVCVDRNNGQIVWDKTVDPYLPEDEYAGMFAQHGYTSHTPVSDGERVYAFFGKTGVVAFDMDGNPVWQTSVGTESGAQNWGTASSPLLYKNLVIVPATAECHSLVALDKQTGSVVWTAEADGFEATWGTPVLAEAPAGEKVLVIGVPGEIWALKPANGKLKWYCKGPGTNAYTASVITHDGVVYALGGREGGTVAVRTGGSGDVTESHIIWTGNQRGGIGTALYEDGRIYWFNNNVANCISAADGAEIYQERLQSSTDDESASQSGDGAQGSRRGRGLLSMDYSSPVAADGKLYFVARSGECYVLALGDEFKQLAVNRFGSDEADFSATPAISDGEIFIRSSKKLYCVSQQ